MSVVRADKLCKRYGKQVALNGLSFTLEPGQILGIIGPNGSGKSTALRSLMGLLTLDDGELSVLGLNPYTQRAQLMLQCRFIADVGTLPRWMRIDQLLAHLAAIDPGFDPAAAAATLERANIDRAKRVRALSKGMTVQLHLAIVMASDARLLVLDEPTLGLDLLNRQRFYDQLLGEFFDEQRAIVITTHEVHEVEHLLTDLIMIDQGQPRLSLSMADYAERFARVTAADSNPSALAALNPLSTQATLDGTVALYDGVDRSQLAALGTVSTPTLSELFLAVMEQAR